MKYFEESERAPVEAEAAPNPAPVTGDDMAQGSSKSTKSPAFQWYPESWFSSSRVQRMSHTERGLYIDLLGYAWLESGLPTDVATIAAMVKLPSKRFARIWANVLHECFYEKNGRLFNARQERERKKQAEFRSKQAANGSHGGRGNKKAVGLSGFTKPTVPESQTKLSISDPISNSISDPTSGKPLDVEFATFRDLYPGERRKGGYQVQQAYMAAAMDVGPAKLLTALRNHIASEQWSNPRLVPGMDTWLTEQRWRQELQPVGADAATLSPAKQRLAQWQPRSAR